MTPSPVAIPFVTLVLLAPIPVWHLLLHGFLPAWRRNPRAYYAAAGVAWALLLPVSWALAQASPLLFDAPDAVTAAGLVFSGASFLVAVWSMATLTPRRFFVWETLHPEERLPVRVHRGPYRYSAHPTYQAAVVAAASNFLASGSAVLLAATVALAVLLTLVAVLEQRELKSRLAGTLPDRTLDASPVTSSTRS